MFDVVVGFPLCPYLFVCLFVCMLAGLCDCLIGCYCCVCLFDGLLVCLFIC